MKRVSNPSVSAMKPRSIKTHRAVVLFGSLIALNTGWANMVLLEDGRYTGDWGARWDNREPDYSGGLPYYEWNIVSRPPEPFVPWGGSTISELHFDAAGGASGASDWSAVYGRDQSGISVFSITFALVESHAFSTHFSWSGGAQYYSAYEPDSGPQVWYSLSGPVGTCFSFGTEHALGAESIDLSGILPPGHYTLDAWASASGAGAVAEGGSTASYQLVFDLTPVPDGPVPFGLVVAALLLCAEIRRSRTPGRA